MDNSSDEYDTYWAVTDDDLTRITGFRFCNCCTNSNGDQEHFRGFSATIYSPLSGVYEQTFGTMDGPDPET